MARRRNQVVRSDNEALCLTETHVRHVVRRKNKGELMRTIPLTSIRSVEFQVVSDPKLLVYSFLLSALAGPMIGYGFWAGELMGFFGFTLGFLALMASAALLFRFYNHLRGRITLHHDEGKLEITSGTEPVELLQSFSRTLEDAQRRAFKTTRFRPVDQPAST